MKTTEVNLNEIRNQFTEGHWRKCGSLVEATLRTIQSNRRAWEGLKDLVHAGCNPAVVLHEIGFYCGTGDAGFWDKEAKWARGQLTKIATRLTRDADILGRIVLGFMEESADQYEGAIHAPIVLRQIAKSLERVLTTLKKHTHGKTGTTKHLVYLSYHIKAATNHRHVIEIARLVAAVDPARYDTSPTLANFSEAIRKEIRRHEKQHEELFREERATIEYSLAAWRQCLSSGRKPDFRLS